MLCMVHLLQIITGVVHHILDNAFIVGSIDTAVEQDGDTFKDKLLALVLEDQE